VVALIPNKVGRGCAVFALVACFPALVSGQPASSPSATSIPITAPSIAPSGESAQSVLGEFATAWAHLTSYTATVTVFERKEAQVQNVVLEYTFHKPSSVTTHVDAGPNAGVTMVWDGGPTVVAHRGSGLAALFKRTFPLHDPQATTIRGSSIDQLSFGAILAHAQQEAGKLTQATQADIGGAGIVAVTLMSADPAANAGLTREIVALSTSTHLPVQVLGYDGAALVRRIDFSKVLVNP
jgi:outer membrane lipoprotein-sorting protein